MLSAICCAQVNYSNYRKWELYSLNIISNYPYKLCIIVIPLLKCCFQFSINIILYYTINRFSFFVLTQYRDEKRKTTESLAYVAITVLASYNAPSQSMRQRCIDIRLASPAMAFLPLPLLWSNRL